VVAGLKATDEGGADLVQLLTPEGERVLASANRMLREQELLRGLAFGHAHRDIARHLGLSETTLKGYARNLYGKLDARDRTQAVLRAVRMGIIRLD